MIKHDCIRIDYCKESNSGVGLGVKLDCTDCPFYTPNS